MLAVSGKIFYIIMVVNIVTWIYGIGMQMIMICMGKRQYGMEISFV